MCVCLFPPPVAKAYLADVTQYGPVIHRQLAMGYLTASFSLARTVSAAIVGVVFSFTENIGGWLEFTIPCAVAAVPLIVTSVVMGVWLPNDAAISAMNAAKRASRSSPSTVTVELVAIGATPKQALNDTADTESEDHSLLSKGKGSVQATESVSARIPLATGLRMMLSNGNVILLTIINAINSFCNGSLLVVQVLVLSLHRESCGYGLSPSAVSVAIGYFGGIAFLFQVRYYKRVLLSMGPLKAYITMGTLFLSGGTCVTVCVCEFERVSLLLRRSTGMCKYLWVYVWVPSF